jgi:hypothetical protein
MQVVVRATFGLAMLAACHTTEHAFADAPSGDSKSNPDDAAGSGGLTLTWSLQPAVPGSPATNISVEEVAFLLVDADITGDAGDLKSTATELHWISGTPAPAPIEFPSAPIGLYSKVSLDIDGQLADNSWWINGYATVNGTSLPFKIYDLKTLDISLDISTQLSPGQPATIPILIELDHAFDAIDFTMIDNQDGTLVLDTYDDYMPTFEANLAQSFVVKSSTQ